MKSANLTDRGPGFVKPPPETHAPSCPAEQRIVSVIVPCRNEKEYIAPFMKSLLGQKLPQGVQLEILIAEGRSDDGTRERLASYSRRNPSIRILQNAERIVSTGLNLAIRQARGEVIVRMDVHTVYAPDYIEQCLRALEVSKADCVGGPWVPVGAGCVSEAIAVAFSSLLVSGGGRAHRRNYEGTVDTVYLGCWPRATFERYGLFDEEFVRTQDSELNLRIIRGGGTVWQTPAIRSWYSPRRSLQQLAGQYTQYGYWKAKVLQKHRLPASFRQLVPGLFLVCLLVLALLAPGSALAAGCLAWLSATYAATTALGGLVACGVRSGRRWKLVPLMPLVFAACHFSFGYGFLRGLLDFVVRRGRRSETLCALTRVSRP